MSNANVAIATAVAAATMAATGVVAFFSMAGKEGGKEGDSSAERPAEQKSKDSSSGTLSSATPHSPSLPQASFPRWTPQTLKETEESLKLDWEPPKNRVLQLRQTRADVASGLHQQMIQKNREQGRQDCERLALQRKNCRQRLKTFLKRTDPKIARKSGEKRKCSECHETVGPGEVYYKQEEYDICAACCTGCYACGKEFDDNVARYCLDMDTIDGKQTDTKRGPEAFVCLECSRFLQSFQCTNCKRSTPVIYGKENCRECSSHVCAGCNEIITTPHHFTWHAQQKDFKEHWCEVCHAKTMASGLQCHSCHRRDFKLHGVLQLRPLHQSAAEILSAQSDGEYDVKAAGSSNGLGRLVCHDCSHPDQQPVVTTEAAAELWKKHVVPYFAAQGMVIPNEALEKVPILLVDSKEMNRLASSVGLGNHTCDEGASTTCGLTLQMTKRMTIRTVQQRNGKVVSADQTLQQDPSPTQKDASVAKKEPETKFSFSVDAIALLYGLPLASAGEILAHEFVHAYHHLYEKRALPGKDGKRAMSTMVSEGTAQLGAYLWLQDTVKNPRFRKLRAMLLHNIENHTTPVYGDGFRQAWESYQRITQRKMVFWGGAPFKTLFQHTAETGAFP